MMCSHEVVKRNFFKGTHDEICVLCGNTMKGVPDKTQQPQEGGYPVSPKEGDTEARHSIQGEIYSDGDDQFDRSEDGPYRKRGWDF